MRTEPAALGAISAGLADGQRDLLTARIRRLAERLGYELLDVRDVDGVADLPALVRDLDVDAVLTPDLAHVSLDRIARACEVITLPPAAAVYYRDGHSELLEPEQATGPRESAPTDPPRR